VALPAWRSRGCRCCPSVHSHGHPRQRRSAQQQQQQIPLHMESCGDCWRSGSHGGGVRSDDTTVLKGSGNRCPHCTGDDKGPPEPDHAAHASARCVHATEVRCVHATEVRCVHATEVRCVHATEVRCPCHGGSVHAVLGGARESREAAQRQFAPRRRPAVRGGALQVAHKPKAQWRSVCCIAASPDGCQSRTCVHPDSQRRSRARSLPVRSGGVPRPGFSQAYPDSTKPEKLACQYPHLQGPISKPLPRHMPVLPSSNRRAPPHAPVNAGSHRVHL